MTLAEPAYLGATLPCNRIKQAALAKRTAYGMYVRLPAPGIVDVAGQAGLDFIRIDLYHGGLSLETAEGLIRAAYAVGLTPTARVEPDGQQIQAILERGALSITVPGVDSPEMARSIVDAARHPPRGLRPSGRPIRTLGVPTPDYLQWANDELVVSVQVESRRGVEAIEEIVAVDGLDMVQSGRSDLAQSLGLAGESMHPQVLAAEERIVEAAWRAGKWVALHFPPGGKSLEQARRWAARGVQCITLGSDTQILFDALRTRTAAARSHDLVSDGLVPGRRSGHTA